MRRRLARRRRTVKKPSKERRLDAALPQRGGATKRTSAARAEVVRLLDPKVAADLGVRPLPSLVLQAGHVVSLDEHVARVDWLSDVDDRVITSSS